MDNHQDVFIEKEESKKILARAISDVGCWRWWDEAEGDVMLEFGGVLLYDDAKKDKEARSTALAACFYEDAFLVFLDNGDETVWYNDLHDDKIDPFTMDPDGLIFDDPEYAISLLEKYAKRHGPFHSPDEAKETIKRVKILMAGTAGDYGFIAGGNRFKVYGARGNYSDDDIATLSGEWWRYWKDYWNKRETDDAYDKDYACEVTIPMNRETEALSNIGITKDKAAHKMELDAEGIKKLVRFELDPEIFTEESDLDLYEDIVFTGTYRPTYHDLVVACENMLRCNVNPVMLKNWYYFVVEENYYEYFEGAWIGRGNNEYLWPGNDDALLESIKNLIDDICFDCDYLTSEEIQKGLREVPQMVELYESNKGKTATEWKLTSYQTEQALRTFYGTTERVPSSRKALFRRIVEEECEKGNETAMYIKGYGCYGGDRIFECDWKESCKWISKLFEKTGNPTYSNTLGYIYYYGRCNNGVPEYEKAFQYFSVGAAHHLLESMYKQADMFLHGKGCIKSSETSDYIIENLYEECKDRFCHGEDAKFADIALRMAAKHQRQEQYTKALYHYLEADYAIKKRLKKSDFFGDKKVQENITKSIQEVKSKIPADYFKEEIVTRNPFWLFEMIDMDCNAKAEIESVGNNRYKILIDRRKKDHPGKALLVAPELESATLTRYFESEFVTKEPIKYLCKDKSNMYVTNIIYSNENEYAFCNADVEIFKIKDADYILKKSDFANDVNSKK